MNCSVVIPVYRSEQTLNALIERLAAVLPNVADVFEVNIMIHNVFVVHNVFV